jgi:hypothetical protein
MLWSVVLNEALINRVLFDVFASNDSLNYPAPLMATENAKIRAVLVGAGARP